MKHLTEQYFKSLKSSFSDLQGILDNDAITEPGDIFKKNCFSFCDVHFTGYPKQAPLSFRSMVKDGRIKLLEFS